MGGNVYGYNNTYGMPSYTAQYPTGTTSSYGTPQAQTGMAQYPAMSQDQVMLNNFYSSPNGQFAASINNQVAGVTYGNDAFVHNALLSDAQWKQQQAAAAQGTTQQPATGTPATGTPTTGTATNGTPATPGTQQPVVPGAQQQPLNTDVTKWDYSNAKKFASDPSVIQTFNDPSVSQPKKDYAAIEFLLNVKNNDVKDRKDDNMEDDKYSKSDIDHAIALANDQKNPGLAAALGRVKNSLLPLDYANDGVTGDKNLTERDDLKQTADFISKHNMSIGVSDIAVQLDDSHHLKDLK